MRCIVERVNGIMINRFLERSGHTLTSIFGTPSANTTFVLRADGQTTDHWCEKRAEICRR
jgi:hypothetical protein